MQTISFDIPTAMYDLFLAKIAPKTPEDFFKELCLNTAYADIILIKKSELQQLYLVPANAAVQADLDAYINALWNE